MKLTEKTIATDPSLASGQADRIVWDDDLKGFGIRIRLTKRLWIIQYRRAPSNGA